MDSPARPLFTIVVLVAGVAGGLAVVIAVVYLYRFCLKKRPPVTTTGKPEAKRDHIRSQAMFSQCRPLPLPLAIAAHLNTSTEHTVETELHDEEDEVNENSPLNIDHIFPTVDKGHHKTNYRSVDTIQNSSGYLSVSEPPNRTQSAEMLLSAKEEEEIRRASFDAPRGTGRKLPSTQGLEDPANYPRAAAAASQERLRRKSQFIMASSKAIDQVAGQPVKQNSNPLPNREARELYDRGHVLSRSWNPSFDGQEHYREEYYQDTSGHSQPHSSHQSQSQLTVPHHISNNSLTVERVAAGGGSMPQQRHPSFRQTKSVDIRHAPPPTLAQQQQAHQQGRRPSMKQQRRANSEVERRAQLMRQATITMLQPKTEVAAECQTLWLARDHLAQLHALGIDDQPTSASTSFESNTEPLASRRPSDVSAQGRTNPEARLSDNRQSSSEDAHFKRNKYKSLLLQRQLLPSTIVASSVDSSVDSSEVSMPPLAAFASSVDSARSDDNPNSAAARRAQQMRNKQMSCAAAICPQPSYPTDRDYSVDARSDNLFRDFSRVDPLYRERDALVNQTQHYSPQSQRRQSFQQQARRQSFLLQMEQTDYYARRESMMAAPPMSQRRNSQMAAYVSARRDSVILQNPIRRESVIAAPPGEQMRRGSIVPPLRCNSQLPPRDLQRGQTVEHGSSNSHPLAYPRQYSVGASGLVVPLICYPD